jgi:CheY-like chemotaxis protein
LKILVLESDSRDLKIAVETAREVGFTEVDTYSSAPAAVSHLERCLEDGLPLPHSIVLELGLGPDSGYALLRAWRENPKLSAIRMIVWTRLEGTHQSVCAYFKVQSYVSKWDGAVALRAALQQSMHALADGGVA